MMSLDQMKDVLCDYAEGRCLLVEQLDLFPEDANKEMLETVFIAHKQRYDDLVEKHKLVKEAMGGVYTLEISEEFDKVNEDAAMLLLDHFPSHKLEITMSAALYAKIEDLGRGDVSKSIPQLLYYAVAMLPKDAKEQSTNTDDNA